VEINRPDKRNAMNKLFWKECRDVFGQIGRDANARCVVLSAAGKIFTAGLDLSEHGDVFTAPPETTEAQQPLDIARRGLKLRSFLQEYQNSFSIIEQIPQPVIAAVHNACVGGGVDMICACDIRLCSQDAWFCIAEVDIGMAADVGTLQRLPKIIGSQSLVRELAYTGRSLTSSEAKQSGLVSSVHKDREATIAAAVQLASVIASKSPIGIIGTKNNLNYARDHSVQDGLDYIAAWNASMLQTADIPIAITAKMGKTAPIFSRL
jgi:delta(3,5)-delta(2,4)-dienoyl-CoA isomerase